MKVWCDASGRFVLDGTVRSLVLVRYAENYINLVFFSACFFQPSLIQLLWLPRQSDFSACGNRGIGMGGLTAGWLALGLQLWLLPHAPVSFHVSLRVTNYYSNNQFKLCNCNANSKLASSSSQ